MHLIFFCGRKNLYHDAGRRWSHLSVPVYNYQDETPDCLRLCSSGSHLCKKTGLFAHFSTDIRFRSMCETLEIISYIVHSLIPSKLSSYLALIEVLPCSFASRDVSYLFLPSFPPYVAVAGLVTSRPVMWFVLLCLWLGNPHTPKEYCFYKDAVFFFPWNIFLFSFFLLVASCCSLAGWFTYLLSLIEV